MSNLAFVIPLKYPAICPICLCDLIGQVIRVYGDVVFCDRCLSHAPYHVLNRIIRRCRESRFNELFVTCSGLLVLAPKPHYRREVLKQLCSFESTDIQYNYPQFIGIVPDKFFNEHLGPPRTVADPHHPYHCPDPIVPVPPVE